MVQVGSQKYKRTVQRILLSYLTCSQIWLNRLIHDQHLTYTTKLEGKKKRKEKETTPREDFYFYFYLFLNFIKFYTFAIIKLQNIFLRLVF